MLGNRLLSALILIICSLLFVGLDSWAYNFGCVGIWMLPLGFYLIFGSAVECTWMVARSPIGAITWPTLLGSGTIMLAACIPLLWPLSGVSYPLESGIGNLGWSFIASALALIGCFVWYFSSFQPNTGVFHRAVLSGWVSCYFGICFSMAIAIRMIEPSHWGLFLLIGIILVTKLADSGAYFAGRAVGRTKLCPVVSPNKTVEGLMGGILAACLGAGIYFGPFARWIFGTEDGMIDWTSSVVIGVALTLAGLVGDLLQSVFKREMGCKDSGKLLPGLGGLWDVTDSILPAAVAGYALARSGWIGNPGQ